MFVQNIQIKSLLSIIGTTIAISSVIGLVPVNAQSNSDRSIANNGLPSHRRDGGTRSNCGVNSKEFVTLVPNTAVSPTVSSNPQLYFHVPQKSQFQTIEFVLRDRQNCLIYETFIETKGRTGIMSVEIPLPMDEKAIS